MIRRFQNSSENPDDLFQIGCIGLIKAIDNFDTTLQVKFSTYAVPMIVGEIRRYLRDNNSIRVSRSLRDIAYKTIYTRENYMRQHLKEPTIAEIADEIGIDKEMIVYAMDAIQSPVSLFEPVYSEGGDTLYVMDQISDKKNREENWVEDISLRDAMNRLGERERHIIDLRFYEGKTQMEVADEIGISREIYHVSPGRLAPDPALVARGDGFHEHRFPLAYLRRKDLAGDLCLQGDQALYAF